MISLDFNSIAFLEMPNVAALPIAASLSGGSEREKDMKVRASGEAAVGKEGRKVSVAASSIWSAGSGSR